MANNVELNLGSGGAVIAADDVAGVHYQIVKLASGAEDAATMVSAAAPLPVGGAAAHDAAVVGPPVVLGATASAAAPSPVSTDGDVVRLWALLNGALGIQVTAAGALIGGDATNGLDVDVTRVTGTVTTKETRSATGTQSSVGDSATSVTVLASNANRLGATVYNDSSALLYLKCGATASTTSFAVKLAQDDYWEVPFGYTGIIDGIWASDAGGNARVTEFT